MVGGEVLVYVVVYCVGYWFLVDGGVVGVLVVSG